MLTGVCLCGVVRYEIEGSVGELTHCHCSTCRKHHGAPFATFVTAAPDALRWLSGEAAVCEYRPAAGRARHFCGACGSVAPALLGDRVLVPAGNLLGELGASGGRHICVGAKAPWHVIADGLPQHEAEPPGWLALEGQTRAAPPAGGSVPGSCLCGGVTFSVTGAPPRWFQCHCSRCRRGRSAAHGSNMFYAASQFTWHSGRELVRKYKPADAERFTVGFCATCGGGTPVERDNVPFVLVPASVFDGALGERPRAHIFVGSKAPWYTIHDDLPQFAELPPQ